MEGLDEAFSSIDSLPDYGSIEPVKVPVISAPKKRSAPVVRNQNVVPPPPPDIPTITDPRLLQTPSIPADAQIVEPPGVLPPGDSDVPPPPPMARFYPDVPPTEESLMPSKQQEAAAPVKQETSSFEISDADFDSEELDAELQKAVKEKKDQPPYDLIGEMYKGAKDAFEYHAKAFEAGGRSVRHGMIWADYMEGKITKEEAQRLTRLTPEQSKLEDELAKLSPFDLRNWGLLAAQSAPFMGAVIQGGAEGAVVIAPIGAGVGLAGGAASPITVPAGTWGGAVLGFQSGAFLTARKIMAGQAFKTFTDAGIPEEPAKHAAIFAGGVMALIENLQLRHLSKTAGQAVDNWMKTAAGQTTLRQVFFNMAENAAVQGAEEVAQQMTQDFTQIGVAKYTDHPEAIPKVEEMINSWAQNFIAGAGVGSIFHVGSASVGATTGASVKAVLKTFDDKFETNKSNLLSELKAKQDALDLADTAQRQEQQYIKEVEGRILKSGEAAEIKTDTTLQKAEDVLAKPIDFETATQRLDDLKDDLKREKDPERVKMLKKEIRETRAQKREAELREKLEEARAQLGDSQDPKLQKRVEAIQEDILEAKRDAITKELDASVGEIETEYDRAVLELEDHQNKTVEKLEVVKQKVAKIQETLDEQLADTNEDALYERADKLLDQQRKLESQLEDSRFHKKVARLASDVKEIQDLREIIKGDDALAIDVINRQRTQIAGGRVEGVGRVAVRNLLNAVKETERNIEDNRRLYDRVVKLALPKAEDRKGLPSAKTLKTPEQLNAAIDKVLATTAKVYEKQARDESLVELKKQLKRSEVKGSGTQRKSTLDRSTDAQRVLDKIRRLVGMNDKDRRAELASIEQKVIDSWMKTKAVDETLDEDFRIASLVGDLGAKESSEVADLVRTIEAITDDAKQGESLRSLTEKQTIDSFLENAVAAIEDPENLIPGREAPKFTNSAKDNLDQLGRGIFSWSGKWRIVFQKARNMEALVKQLDIYPIVENIRTLKRTSVRSVFSEVAKSTGMTFDKAVDYSLQASKDMISFKYDKGTFEGTRSELMQFVAWSKVEKLRAGLENGNGFTFVGKDSWIEKAEAALTPTDMNVIDGLEAHYKKQAPLLAQAFKQLTGLDLEIEEWYGGRARRTRVSEDKNATEFDSFQLDLAAGAKTRFQMGQPTSTVTRTSSKLALKNTDIFTNALQSAVLNSHYIAWAPHMKFFNRVISDSKLLAAIERNYGQKMVDSLTTHLKNTIHGEVQISNVVLDFFTHVMRNAWTYLAAKPLSYIKQYTSVINIARKVPLNDFIEGYRDYYKNSTSHANKIIESTNFWSNRYDDFDSTIAGIIMDKDVKGMKSYNLKRMFLFPMLSGDKEVTRVGWWIAYKSALKQNMSTEDAIVFANKAIDTTQSTSNAAELSDVARNGYARVAFAFGQQPARLFEDEITEWRNATNQGTLEAYKRAVGISILNRLSQLMFMSVGGAWALALAHDDKEREAIYADLITSFIVGSVPPALSDIASSISDGLHGERPNKLQVIPLATLSGAFELLQLVSDHGAKGDLDKHFGTAVYMYARSLNLMIGGIPAIEPIAREFSRKEKGKGSILDLLIGK